MEILIAVAVAAAVILAYRLGQRDGRKDPPKPFFNVKSKAKVESDRWDDILANIEIYDGTAEGQKEVRK